MLTPPYWRNISAKIQKIFGKVRNTVMSHGFTHVEIIGKDSRFGDIRLSKTESHHGHWWMLPVAGHTCGYVLRYEAEPVCYLAGDTIWYSGVRRNIDR